MELLAAGFNAWNQLIFEESLASSDEPNDVISFSPVLRGPSVGPVCAFLACTLVKTSASLASAGFIEDWLQDPALQSDIIASAAAVAGNGTVSRFSKDGVVDLYPINSNEPGTQAAQSLGKLDNVVQVVAYETGFAARSAEGYVWTWGDERYSACLAREPTDEHPAAKPARVTELESLPTGKIKKIAAGGYLVLALTEGNDLYGWGGHPGREPILEEVSSCPEPVLIEDYDITDVGVGDSHVIALTAGGEVFVIGENGNGQLGLEVDNVTSWTKVPLTLEAGHSVVGVAAGPKCSFILTQKQ